MPSDSQEKGQDGGKDEPAQILPKYLQMRKSHSSQTSAFISRRALSPSSFTRTGVNHPHGLPGMIYFRFN